MSHQFGEEKEELSPDLKARLDELLTNVWLNGTDDGFHQIFHLIMSENVSGGLFITGMVTTRTIYPRITFLLLFAQIGKDPDYMQVIFEAQYKELV